MSTQRGLSLSWLEDLLPQLAAHHPCQPVLLPAGAATLQGNNFHGGFACAQS